MDQLLRMKIGTRLALSFGLVLLLACLVGFVGLYQTSRVNDGAVEIGTNWLPSVKTLGDVRGAANSARRTVLRHVLEDSADGKRAQAELHAKALREDLEPALKAYEGMISSPEEKRLADDFRAKLDASLALDAKVLALSDQGEASFAEARHLVNGDGSRAFAEFMTALGKDVELNNKGGLDEVANAAQTYRYARIEILVLLGVAVAVGAWLAWACTGFIVRRLKAALEVAQSVAAGDLTSHVDASGHDEIAELLRALEEMNANLTRIVGTVRDSSESISTGSQEVAIGNADLSQRTEQQAAALEETAATMDELGSTVRQNADNARQADALAQGASDVAARGGTVVGQVVDTMRSIDQASKKIADIIGVIDGIAFQTNILALNAAVEAARAGEQGRGFAVVAGEVRSLAQRSAEAAREIKSLIGSNVERVAAGSALADEAGATMGEIVGSIQRVTQIIGEIASASAEQSSGVSQVGEAVTQMDQVTQQNAALVEESAAAAESLKQQALALVQVVSVFKLRRS
jgi:methyl-accepting chemotaxis protein